MRTDNVDALAQRLLGDNDPHPVEILNADGTSPFVITCEHAGRTVPEKLADLGIAERHFDRHIAWDIGVDALGRALAASLDATVVFQRYSRLVIDCNRPLWAEDAIPEVSDGTTVPANTGLSESDRQIRYRSIHQPFHDTVADCIDRRLEQGRRTAVIALHSFTPELEARPAPRPWHFGILFNRDASLSRQVHSAMEQQASHLTFTYNQPYEVNDHGDYTIPVHGEKRGLPHSLFEIRNDQIAEQSGQTEWANLLTGILNRVAQHL